MITEALRGEVAARYRANLEKMAGVPSTSPQPDAVTFASTPVSFACYEAVTSLDLGIEVKLWLVDPAASAEEQRRRAYQVAQVLSLGIAMFEEAPKAFRWLSKPKDRFQGRSPLAMLQTEDGMQKVEELLIQMGEGYSL